MKERKKIKQGGYLDTEEKLLAFFRGLTGKRKDDMEFGKTFGLNVHQIDTLRLVFNKVEYHSTYLNEEDIAKVVEMYKSGMRIKSIQESLNMSMSNIYYILNNRVERDRHEFWTPIKEKRLVYMKEVQKLKWREIAAVLGKSMNACCEKYKIIKRNRAKEVA